MTHYHEHYDHYDPNAIKRLDGFYGDVENNIHKNILKNISGQRILDIGCGFGSLVNYLEKKGYQVRGIDQHEPSIEAGLKHFVGISIQLFTDSLDKIPAGSVDTITLKDVIHHIYDEDDIEAFLQQIKRIALKRLIIVDPNPTFILKLSRKLIGHVDPICPPDIAIQYLEKSGFVLRKVFYSEFLAFPLSGGYVGPVWIKNKIVKSCILALDKGLNSIFKLLRLDRIFCWRYYIVADIK